MSAENAEFTGLFLIRFQIADIFKPEARWEQKKAVMESTIGANGESPAASRAGDFANFQGIAGSITRMRAGRMNETPDE